MADREYQLNEIKDPTQRIGYENMGDGTHAEIISLGSTGGRTRPFDAIREGGLATLVGVNDRVDQNDYGTSVGVGLAGSYSGEILNIMLFSGEAGTGAVQTPAGAIYVFDTNPGISAGDTAMGIEDRRACIGMVDVAAGDWKSDGNGATAYLYCEPIAFHAVTTLWFCWFHEAATSYNDAAGDDEFLQMNIWYRRDS